MNYSTFFKFQIAEGFFIYVLYRDLKFLHLLPLWLVSWSEPQNNTFPAFFFWYHNGLGPLVATELLVKSHVMSMTIGQIIITQRTVTRGMLQADALKTVIHSWFILLNKKYFQRMGRTLGIWFAVISQVSWSGHRADCIQGIQIVRWPLVRL